MEATEHFRYMWAGPFLWNDNEGNPRAQSGGSKRTLQDDLVWWYSLFAGSISHNWSPRKAKHRGFSPELEPSPSLRPLLPTGPPTPLYGPRAHGRRATSSHRPCELIHDQEAENEEGFEDLLDDNTAEENLTTESAATAAAESNADPKSAAAAKSAVSKSDAAPLRTEDKGETSPSELRAARLEKQKAMKLRDTQSRISKSSKKGERSVSGGPTSPVQATASQIEVPSTDPDNDNPDVPRRDAGRLRVKIMRRRLGLTHGKKCFNCETTNKKDCPGPMAPNNNKNNNNQPEILGAVSKGSIRFNSRAASLPEKRGQSPVTDQNTVTKKSKRHSPALQSNPNVVMITSTQCGFPFPYISERIDTLEEGINKRLDKLESFAINTNARAKTTREVFDKDTVVLRPRSLAHQVILFETRSLNQATLAQILAEDAATMSYFAEEIAQGVKKATDEATIATAAAVPLPGPPSAWVKASQRAMRRRRRSIMAHGALGAGRMSLREVGISLAQVNIEKEVKKEVTKLKEELGLNQVKLDICITWITREDEEKDKKELNKKEQEQEVK
ncbi:hypothetical protein FPCIR_11157 [Fusarium pseudocircinatum]|uniref:Uncharacterized protein n=1 Tax=Fusarium pseudocircinatum TaxID=56676 RepID=A0A8H5NV24_9HYPO|nr:hypothetical protein FPCIR_11157 [Fusarium pseudocircinatum]